jgi:hypothetical protein
MNGTGRGGDEQRPSVVFLQESWSPQGCALAKRVGGVVGGVSQIGFDG